MESLPRTVPTAHPPPGPTVPHNRQVMLVLELRMLGGLPREVVPYKNLHIPAHPTASLLYHTYFTIHHQFELI